MKILNLVYPEQSDIVYQISKFPDGQQDIIIEPIPSIISMQENVQIKSCLNSFKDLELIICATAALRRLDIENIHLYIPYLLGARSDRQFVDGGTSYLVDVITPIINAQNFKSVTLLDCHSDVGVALVKKSKNISNVKLVQWALTQIDNTFEAQSKVALVSPDGGALKKIYETATGAKLECDIIISAKHRDIRTGKLSGFDVPVKEHQLDKTLVWVDDICDGGGTFIGEVLKANEVGHRGKKYLIVTHGIFSAGFGELGKYFDGIFCTNSIHDLPKAISNNKGEKFVKQLNIF